VLRKRAGQLILASERLFDFHLPSRFLEPLIIGGALSQTKPFVAKLLLQFLLSHVRKDTTCDSGTITSRSSNPVTPAQAMSRKDVRQA
jgi:hypothetical protein